MNLLCHAQEDEGRKQHVGDGVRWDEHQHPVCVRRQPDVVLTHEQLQRDATEPRKEGRETGAQHAHLVAQDDVPKDLNTAIESNKSV